MEQQFVLISIINSTKAFKKVKERLKDIGYNRYTAIDSIGGSEIINHMEYSSMFTKSLSELDNLKYNKTLVLVLPNEEEAVRVMDELEQILHMDPKIPGKGIMFTIPIITCQGVRFEGQEC